MKKRYGLDSIIGKKSKLRFPDHIGLIKTHSLYFTLPANDAISEPPLSTAITMKKGDPLEFCDQFNEESYDFEEGLPLNVIIYVSVSSLMFEIKPTSTHSLFGIAFGLDDVTNGKFRASKTNIFLCALNFGLIQLSPTEDFFMADWVSKVRSIYASLATYHSKRKYRKPTMKFFPKIRLKRYLLNFVPNHRIKFPQQYRLERYMKKNLKFSFKKLLPSRIQQIYTFYDTFELLEDLEDHFYEDLKLDIYTDLLDQAISSVYFIKSLYNLESYKTPVNYLYNLDTMSTNLLKEFLDNSPEDSHLYILFKYFHGQLSLQPTIESEDVEASEDVSLETGYILN
jgi:ribosomal protein L11